MYCEKLMPAPDCAPVLILPSFIGGSGILVFSGSFLSLSLVLRVVLGSSRNNGRAFGVMMLSLCELEVRYAADPVGARERSKSDRPFDFLTVRDAACKAPFLEMLGSYRTCMLMNKRCAFG